MIGAWLRGKERLAHAAPCPAHNDAAYGFLRGRASRNGEQIYWSTGFCGYIFGSQASCPLADPVQWTERRKTIE
jgi:hypothetical protein